MHKLKLDVDSLHVESFAAVSPTAQGGTVQGQMQSPQAGAGPSVDLPGGFPLPARKSSLQA
jgi:hypothetical protein